VKNNLETNIPIFSEAVKTSGYLHIPVPVTGELIVRIQVHPCPASVKRRDYIIIEDIVLEAVNP
jgi:hypothetical protein